MVRSSNDWPEHPTQARFVRDRTGFAPTFFAESP
jgi:hypothetical protein